MNRETVFEEIAVKVAGHDLAVVDYLFDEDLLDGLCNSILAKVEAGSMKMAGTGNRNYHQVNDAVRNDRIEWLSGDTQEANEKKFLQIIGELSEYLNRTCYAGIRSNEFHYACFEKGAFYKRHLDRFKNDDARKLSVITYLNKNWKPEYGGELAVYLGEKVQKVMPVFGTTVVFRSHILEHEVLPATQHRLSITGWLR